MYLYKANYYNPIYLKTIQYGLYCIEHWTKVLPNILCLPQKSWNSWKIKKFSTISCKKTGRERSKKYLFVAKDEIVGAEIWVFFITTQLSDRNSKDNQFSLQCLWFKTLHFYGRSSTPQNCIFQPWNRRTVHHELNNPKEVQTHRKWIVLYLKWVTN